MLLISLTPSAFTLVYLGDAPVKITWSREVKGPDNARKEYKEISDERGVV